MAKKSPTARTLERQRKEGWTAQVVEKWNAHARVRIDLFGCLDVVAIGNGILGVQATSGSNLAARRTKSAAEPKLLTWLASGGRFQLWGWRKLKKSNRWEVRRVEGVRAGEGIEWVEVE